MSKAQHKTRRRRRDKQAADYTAVAEQFSRRIMRLPDDFDPSVPVSAMYRHALTPGRYL